MNYSTTHTLHLQSINRTPLLCQIYIPTKVETGGMAEHRSSKMVVDGSQGTQGTRLCRALHIKFIIQVLELVFEIYEIYS
ncbi:hypothetical protein AAHA92_32592 [Salvia divinorum]|uniref:Uncharacterized protein n=1 Tax=Salvia divinorum TaxID=28513 RepID=A0ABD1FL91_SALDI